MFRKILIVAMFATAAGYCFAAESLPQVVTSEVFYEQDVYANQDVYEQTDMAQVDYGDVYTFTVYDNGVEVETLTYSVNSYVYSKMNSDNPKMAGLALALYRAGASAADWVANHGN